MAIGTKQKMEKANLTSTLKTHIWPDVVGSARLRFQHSEGRQEDQEFKAILSYLTSEKPN